MKKFFKIIILLIPLVLFIIYSFAVLPKQIKVAHKGIAYKIDDTEFVQNTTIKLDGYYDKKSQYFKGKLNINNEEYKSILTSGSLGVFYEEDERNIMGQIYISDEFKEISLEIENDEVYNQLTGDKSRKDKLIISVPTTNREEAIKLNRKLINNYCNERYNTYTILTTGEKIIKVLQQLIRFLLPYNCCNFPI